MDNPANPEDLATAARPATQAILVLKVLLARADLLARLARLVSAAATVAMARAVARVLLDRKELLATLDRKDLPDLPATLATKVVLDVLAKVAILDRLANQETPARKVLLAHRARLAKTHNTARARHAARTSRKTLCKQTFCRQNIVEHRKPMRSVC